MAQISGDLVISVGGGSAPVMDGAFSNVLKNCLEGSSIKREGWDNAFVYFEPVSVVPQALIKPAPVLRYAIRNSLSDVTFSGHLDKFENGSVTIGWAPSQYDIYANDWVVV